MIASRRYQSLDAWRGVAALSVLLWHRYYDRTAAAAFLWLGVQLFFVIALALLFFLAFERPFLQPTTRPARTAGAT